MKKLFTLLAIVLLTATVWAQVPQSFKYQAVARDVNGNAVTGQAVGLQISILSGSIDGEAVYVETFAPTTNDFGLINLEIGKGTVVSGDFASISWSSNVYFIKVEMDISGGTAYEEFGTSQLLSVPYALHAKTAANTFSGNYNDLEGAPANVSAFTNDIGYLTSVTETDPAFTSSQAVNIKAGDITNLENLSGINSGDQDISGIAINTQAIQDTALQIRSDFPDVSEFITDEADPLYAASIVAGITGTDTSNWNHKLDSYTETQDLADVLSQSNDGGLVQIKNIANPTDSQDVVTVSYLDTYTHEGFENQNLVLWNKLGSEAEVLASETGENGELVGTGHAYESAKFGNGYVRTDLSSYVKFPQSVLENCRSRGTVEFWVNPKVTNPVAFSYGAFMLVGYSISGSNAFAFVRWGDGTTGQGICGGVNFDGSLHRTPDEAEQFVATIGLPFHISLVWDVAGIDDTEETIRIYRDGTVIGVSTETWNDNATVTYDNFYIGTGPDGGGYDKYIMDNIKVWKYAKTDYSDINTENESGLYTAGAGIDITDNVISVNDIVIQSDIDADLSASGTKTNAVVDVNTVGYAAALFLAADGNYEEADADAEVTMPCLALALETGTGAKDILLHGYIRNNAWSWTVGAPVYVSATEGELTQTIPSTAGQQVQVVGYATATNTLYFNPDMTIIELK